MAGTLLCACATLAAAQSTDWPSYNRTLTSERHSPLAAINPVNVRNLKTVCTYDTGQTVSFQSKLVQVEGALFGATEQDTFSINPDTCAENWRVHEEFASGMLKVNRGVAYLDGRIFRGTPDGRVVAYEARTGKRLWATTIADSALGESVPTAPIAWNGLVFAGNAGGDMKGVKGRMYALDAATGAIVWEFFLVPHEALDMTRGPAAPLSQGARIEATWDNPKDFPITGGATWTSYTLDPQRGLLYIPTGNPAPDFVPHTRKGDNLYTGSVVVLDARSGVYQKHYQLVAHDFHDWDVSTPPMLIPTRSGRRLMAVMPKDGHLYGYDLDAGSRLYREPVTTIPNAETPLTAAGTRFCPGSQGGAEWNGPSFDPEHNLVFSGTANWCATVHADPPEKLRSVAPGRPWSGSPDGFGKFDDVSQWAGWLTASDADSGKPAWRFKAPAPIMGGVTSTAGGLVLFGDMGGNFYAFESVSLPLFFGYQA
jgi:glucose dehydrogenase